MAAPQSGRTAADKAAAGAGGSDGAFSFTELGDQLKRLGTKIQSATSAGAQRGLEFTSSLTGGSGNTGSAGSGHGAQAAAAAAAGAAAGAGGTGAAGAAGAADAAAGTATVGSLLEEDPDLEAYLQVGCPGSTHGGKGARRAGRRCRPGRLGTCSCPGVGVLQPGGRILSCGLLCGSAPHPASGVHRPKLRDRPNWGLHSHFTSSPAA